MRIQHTPNFLLAALLWLAAALPAQAQFVPGARQADIHNPFSNRYVSMRPGGILGSTGYNSITAFVGNWGGWGGSWGGYGQFNYGYGIPYRNYGFSYGYGSPLWGGRTFSYSVAPLYVPGQTMYGPGALRDFINGGPVGGVVQQPPLGPLPPLAADVANPQPNLPVPSNAEAREKARTWMEFGDRHFGLQDYRDAYQRYKKAAEAAPDLVEPYLLQGQTMLAVGNYEMATRLFNRALTMHPQWAQATFDLKELYARHPAAKASHMEALAAAAEKDPNNGDLMLLVGVQLYYDGQAERSLPFFRKAKELSQVDFKIPEVVPRPQADARQPQAF